MSQCVNNVDSFCNDFYAGPTPGCIPYDEALRRSQQAGAPSAMSGDITLDEAAALKTPEARARRVCTMPRYLNGPGAMELPGKTWTNGFSSCVHYMLAIGSKTVREYIAEDEAIQANLDEFKSLFACKIYGYASPNLAASMGCLYREELWTKVKQRWEKKRQEAQNAEHRRLFGNDSSSNEATKSQIGSKKYDSAAQGTKCLRGWEGAVRCHVEQLGGSGGTDIICSNGNKFDIEIEICQDSDNSCKWGRFASASRSNQLVSNSPGYPEHLSNNYKRCPQ
jgi:hypothetical protein